MIYTYNKNTFEVEAFSEGYNEYSNPDLINFEYEEAPSQAWLVREDKNQKLKYKDGEIVLE